MGIDCGFDIYPPLEGTKSNQEQYELFLREVLDAYGRQDGGDAEQRDGGSVVRVNAESDECYVVFEVGEHPRLPRRCEDFMRFSSKISGKSLAEPYIRGLCQIAKRLLGDRVYFWHELNEFGPHIRHSGCYNWNEIYAARKKIRERKELDDGEQRETNMQYEAQQSGNGTEGMASVRASHKMLYTIKPIKGKGLGFIAACKIPKGTRVLLEVPLFRTPDSTEDIGLAETIALREVKRLTKDQQRAFFALQNVQERKKCTPVLGIAITNMLPLGSSGDGGLFLEASRINHSCQPNAQHAWNDKLNYLTVHAMCDIEANREITISYMSGVSLGFTERQRHLMDAFAFVCACELCSLPSIARTESDYRLDQIRCINESAGVVTDLEQVLEQPSKALSQVRRSFELLEAEGICDIRLSQACFNAFQIAAVAGDKARAKAFAERAYVARKVLTGDDNPATIEFKHFATRPVDYRLYGEGMTCYDEIWEAPRGMCAEKFDNWLWNTDGWSRQISSR